MPLRAHHALSLLLALASASCGKPQTVLVPTYAASAAPPKACHVSSDCGGGDACVYEPGCDAPVAHCAPRKPVECRASTPIATCSGEPLSACRDAQIEVAYLAFAEETSVVDVASLMGKVASVVVHRAPENLQADVAMTAERLEKTTQFEHSTSRDPEVIRTAIDILRIAGADRGTAQADLRMELVLLDAGGNRLAALGVDKFGQKGFINGTPVTFRHVGALGSLRNLAQKLSGHASP